MFINDSIKLEIFLVFFLFGMITLKMEQKIDELKKNIDQRFETQSEIIKSVIPDVCALLIENCKGIFQDKTSVWRHGISYRF